MNKLISLMSCLLMAGTAEAVTYDVNYTTTASSGHYVDGDAGVPGLEVTGSISLADGAGGTVDQTAVVSWTFRILGADGELTISSGAAAGGFSYLEGSFKLNGKSRLQVSRSTP